MANIPTRTRETILVAQAEFAKPALEVHFLLIWLPMGRAAFWSD